MSAANPFDAPDFWRQARQLFHALSTLPVSQHAAHLRDAAPSPEVFAAVQRLLALRNELTGSIGLPEPDDVAKALGDALADGETETAIAEFRLERLIGEGGMGRVYLATRELGDTTQHVALKIVPRAADGRRLVEQLRRERSILAGLDHPHIARFIDAGELPDGRPFFAMEYVDGVPLTRHCDEASLDLRARIALFLDVCDAVAYAHRRLVLHRDIKANNILVDAEGRPRLLDFGIAKSLADAQARDTTVGQNYFSLRTAAPEQIRGAATTVATDVYGLGCLLCELLSGHLPFDLDGDRDLLRRIAEQPAPLASALAAAGNPEMAARRHAADPSALTNTLRGDLDTIVARTLRKDPADRYRSVDDLAADLQNVLDLRPIQARASERWYRLRMLVRRNRVTTVVASVLGLAVIAMTALSIAQSLRANAERDRAVAALEAAQLQRDHAQRVTDFLVGAFQGSDRAQGLTRDLRATELVDNAAASLQNNSTGLDPALRATLAQTLAHLFYLLQRIPEAIRQTELARNELNQLAEPSRELRIQQSLAEAETALLTNSFASANQIATQGLELAGDAAIYADGELLHRLWEAKIRALQGSGDNPGSLRSTEMALKQLAKRADYKPERVDWIRLQRASGLYAAGTHLDYQREAGILLNDMRNGGRTHDALYIETLRQTARSHSVYSEFAAALPLYEEAVALQISLYGENHKTMPALLGGLASVYDGLKRLDEGRELYRRAIESSERIFGKTHRTTASINYYAADQQYFSYRNLTEAERLVRRAIAANPPEARGNAAIFHHRLAELLVLQEKLFEADYHASLAYDIAISTYAFGELIHITPVNSAYIALRRYNLPAASRLLTGSLIGTVRQFKLYYYVRMSIEADALGAFFGWNRESDGSTIVPPMRR